WSGRSRSRRWGKNVEPPTDERESLLSGQELAVSDDSSRNATDAVTIGPADLSTSLRPQTWTPPCSAPTYWRPSEAASSRIYAALDLGTNNCRLLIARPSRRGFQVMDAFSRIIKLGEGVSTTGRLSEAAMARTWDALKVCAAKMRRHNVSRSRLVA